MKRYLAAGLQLLLALFISACHSDFSDDEELYPVPTDADSTRLYVSFTMAVSEGGGTRADADEVETADEKWGDSYTPETTDYETTAYDAGINPEKVHVALFSATGAYLTTVKRLECYPDGAGTYQYRGEVTETELLTSGTEYRCMVVANTASVDFTQLSSLTYEASDLPQATSSEGYYIPAWGVQSFTLEGKETKLGTISLLRAAVKCRICLSDALKTSGNELQSVKFHTRNLDGYIAPTGFDTKATTDLSIAGCFRPTEAQKYYEVDGFVKEKPYTAMAFFAEPEADDGTLVCYFPECENTVTNEAYLTVTIVNDETTTEYEWKFNREQLVRNHLYDLEITNISKDVSISVTACSWDLQYSSVDFTEEIAYQEEYGDGAIKWEEGTYGQVDQTSKTITLLKGVTLVGTIGFRSPIGGTVLATMASDDADDTSNSILFVSGRTVTSTSESDTGTSTSATVTGTTYTTSEIDGKNLVIFYIRAANENNSRQHRASLQVYVKYLDGTTQEVSGLKGWTILQPY
jgi:hypothetical protein